MLHTRVADIRSFPARHQTPQDSILYASCFDANAAIFETLLTPEDAVISDQLNHASIIDGIRLCTYSRVSPDNVFRGFFASPLCSQPPITESPVHTMEFW